ncbi:ABC transporter ATP-binding protein [Photobacterium sp. ZSDE20]|uniref:ABC transporter ATP-binding protein n=1 Tax=Photobacterium pectinilyticum TaxID=2906793 RepID=A0ABT1N6E4_9GAMM|nr:ABC transporter ATP-binding protein [Photobacterium sp. ZSDE20]MCQ1060306.1 ABC transporter ATP-binding protein [Photobacterium sp. ZSDE20]MDD1827604.1 ABC transporter ATP-binding protein [Photobacterium sp. ZSDE20]
MASISLRNIDKTWGSSKVIEDLNLEVNDKEFLVLLGPSGCGKTTTMRMIAGLDTPTAGDVEIDQERVNDTHPRDRDIAMVFQNYGLYPQKTVYGNIAFPLQMKKVDKDELHARVIKAAKRVELDQLLERKPSQLSGGQRQRVALARAIVREPSLFLMDEPLSNLDAKLRVSMRALLKNLHYEFQRTTVYVTHDQIEAMTLADRVAVLYQGKIQQLDTPKNIYNNPRNLFVAGFIGSPSMNFIKGSVKQGSFKTGNCQVSGLGIVSNARVTLGVRPEDIEVCSLAKANLTGEIYSIEMTGESTLITLEVNGNLVVARADKNFEAKIGDPIGFKFNLDHTYLFNTSSEQRIDYDVSPELTKITA